MLAANNQTPMKRLVLMLLLLCPTLVPAQVYVTGKDINQLPDVEYIELIVDMRLFRQRQVYAIIDYGQTIRWGELYLNRIQDERGQDRLFGSEMDIFNFLYKSGWVHELTYSKEEFVYHIFRRRSKEVPR